MRKIILLSLVFVISLSCDEAKKKNTCSITGTIENVKNQKLYVMEKKGYDYVKTDSTTIKDGKFHLELKNAYPRDLILVFEQARTSVIQLYVEAGDITVTGDYNDLRQVVRSGTKTLELQRTFDAILNPMLAEMKELTEQFENINRNEMSADDVARVVYDIKSRYTSIDSTIKVKMDSTIDHNNDNVFAAALLLANQSLLNLSEVQLLISRLSPSIPKNAFLDKMTSLRDRLAAVELGASAPEIVLSDTSGQEIKLSSLRDKVVLIDFWATWSKEWNNDKENLSSLYEKYKDKGFAIYSVSLDNSKEEWRNFITQEKIAWCNVFEETGKFMDQYVVSNVPFRVLIDKEGKIIAKNDSLAAFEKEITKLLNL